MAAGPVDEQIKIQYLLDTQQATKELEELSDLTQQYKKSLQELQNQSGKTFDEIATGAKNAARASAEALKAQGRATDEVNKTLRRNNQAITQATRQLKENEKQVKKNTQVFKELATTLKFVLITIVGGALFNAFQTFTQFLTDSAEKARDFNKQVISLSLGLRELQRQGSDITFEQLNDEIERLTETFKFISEEEATKVFAVLTSKFGQLGLSIGELGELAETAIGLSLAGSFSTAEDAAVAFANFGIGGISQSLNNAGIQADQASVKLLAASRGLNLNDLSERKKALLRLEVILDAVADKTEDAKLVSESFEGKLQDIEGQVDKTTIAFGELVLPFKLFAEGVKLRLITGLNELGTTLVKIIILLASFADGVVAAFREVAGAIDVLQRVIRGELEFDDLVNEFSTLGSRSADAFSKSFQETFSKAAKGFGLTDDSLFEDAPRGDPADFGEGFDATKAEEIFRDLFAKILELQRDFERDSEELWEDYQRDLADITEKGKRKLLDIEEKFSEDLEDIEERRRERTEDANRDLAQGIEDVNRKFRQKLEDAQRDFREEEIRAERDFQEELRRLREDFLFDLDEAVRDRDARQIARLIKKFQLDKDRLLREREQDREDREKDFQDELEDIKRWRERRLQELRIEFQRRLEEIAKQAKREREEAEKRRQRAEEDLAEELKRQRDDRREAYDQQQRDLEDALDARIAELVLKTGIEKEITSEAADFIANKFREVFGKGGRLEKTFGEFLVIIENALDQALKDLDELNDALDETLDKQDEVDDAKSDDTDESGNTNSSSDTSGFASGGTLVATKPTLAMFGEAQPEVAQFTTLSQMNSVASLNQPVPQLAEPSTMEGKMTLEVLLSPDLEARIVDNSVGAVADVVIGVQGSQPL